MTALFVSLEGLSGVGKSTVAPLLARALRAEIVPAVPTSFEAIRRQLNESTSIDARFCFFLCAVICSGSTVACYLNSGRPVVVESYLYRTVAFHRGMGAKLMVDCSRLDVLPTHVFHLTCSEAERLRRRAERGEPEHRSKWDTLAECSASAILKEYACFPMQVIDTSQLTPAEVVLEIERRL